MGPVMLAEIYKQAVTKQSQAQIEFETSELAHRARNKAALLECTRAVVAAAASLQAALEPNATVAPARGAPVRRAPTVATQRATTPAEEDLLRQLLTGDLLPRQKRSGSSPAPEERPRPARAPDGSFISQRSHSPHAGTDQETDQASDVEA